MTDVISDRMIVANGRAVDLYENNHIKRLSEGKCSAEIGMLYVEALTDLERISDHALNIAEAGQA